MRRLLLSAALCARLSSPAAAQSVSAPALKAAFVFNFAKFTEWPLDALPSGRTIVFCVVGDAEVAAALEQTMKDGAIDGHPLLAKSLRHDEPLRDCHVLYVGVSDPVVTANLLSRAKTAPVFTVGIAEAFAARGGIGQLILENGRMRFAMNIASAQRARLRLSSRLLSLAEIVREESNGQP